MSKGSFYITTTLPYVNADLHMGHALEFVRADAIARYKKLLGFDVFFNTGTDEHGLKIYEKAVSLGKDPQAFVDESFSRFQDSVKIFGMDEEILNFVRTTDEHHIRSAQTFWKKVYDNGYIYKKNYEAKYCVGCEENKNDSELVNGECPIHPGRKIEIIKEENYFFKYSEFADKLKKLYLANPNFVVPEFRFNEIKKFIDGKLQDFSISRLKSKMPWGIEVPGDSEHVMYVWFDALINYISTLGWPEDKKQFEKFWVNGTPTQYCGKDNIRFQSAMWQSMLIAAGLPNSHQIIINGFITGEGGVRMSKSLGNVVNPVDVVKEYGTDALRYFLLREISSFEDSPFTMERFKDAYNANLANGLGNLASRILTLSEKYLDKCPEIPDGLTKEFREVMATFDIKKATDLIWDKVRELDEYIQKTEPFKIIKTDKEKGQKLISEMAIRLYAIARMLNPIMPETNITLKKLIRDNKKPEKPLFPRKD